MVISFLTLMSLLHPITGEVVDRYAALEAGVNDWLEELQRALSQSQGVQENLDMLEKWLEEVENKDYILEQGTVIPARRDPILEQIENTKMLEDDIANHKPAIDAVNRAVQDLIRTGNDRDATRLSDKLDKINNRYRKVSVSTKDHHAGLQSLADKLGEFEREVDDLEDWLLPDLENLESLDIMQQDVGDTANAIRVSSVK